jgi:DNA repair exonuclease SbcCD nuclease subunit
LSKEESLYWARDNKEERCFGFIREIIETISPDLILIAGDLVYGEFDHDGTALLAFIEFMESFAIPWAPVFGNHETESDMGGGLAMRTIRKSKVLSF